MAVLAGVVVAPEEDVLQGAPIRLTPDINMGGTPLLAVSWVLDGTRQLQFHEFGLSSCLWPPYHS